MDKAISDMDEAIRLDPKEAEWFNMRGSLRFVKNDFDQAGKDLDQAIQLNPKNAQYYCNRGCVWLRKNELDKATKDFDEAIRLEPECDVAYQGRALVYTAMKEYGRAIKEYDEVIRFKPFEGDCYSLKAWLLATCEEDQYRDGKTAVMLARRSCELEQHYKPSYLNVLAAAYAEVGDFSLAVELQKKVLEDAEYEKECGKEARERLKLYEGKKPYRDH